MQCEFSMASMSILSTVVMINNLLISFQGGILWFQNLTELPHGVLGPIIPLLIGGLHFVNVQVLEFYFSLLICEPRRSYLLSSFSHSFLKCKSNFIKQ